MIVFTHIPKTAGTTLKMILRNNYGTGHIDSAKVKRPVYTARDLAFARKIFRNPQAISGHNLVHPVRHIGGSDMQLVVFLRDPVVRCASHFQDDVLRGGFAGTLNEWLSDPWHQNLTVRIISGSEDLGLARQLLKEKYLFVGITERFSDSMKLLQVKLGHPLNTNYRRMITARSNDVKNHILSDQASVELLEKHNALDRDLYDFALNSIFIPETREYATEMQHVNTPVEKKDRTGERNFQRSVKFNKWVYRPLVRVTGNG